MTNDVDPEALQLQRLYHWEKTAPDRVVLTQPMAGGLTRDFTWREVMDESGAWPRTSRALGSSPDRASG